MTDGLHAAAGAACAWLVQTTLGVVAVVALVALVQRLVGRALSVRWRHALWCLVVVRLLLPVAPPSPLSVLNLFAHGAAAELVASELRTSPPSALHSVARARATPSRAEFSGLDLAALRADAAAQSVPPPATASSVAWPLTTWIALVWGAGAALALAWTYLRERRFRGALRREPELVDVRVARVLAEVCSAAEVRRAPRVIATDLVESPALSGVLRPTVLLPRRAADALDDDALRHVLRHEIAHLRAGDVLGNWLLAVLAALHWFDPLVHFAFARLRAAREELRDATALAGCDAAERAAYGHTLLRLIEDGTGAVRARRGPSVATAGIVEGRRDLRRRIEMIAKGGHGGRRAWVLGVCAAGAVAALALTGSMAPAARAQDEGRGAEEAPAAHQPAAGAPVLRTRIEAAFTDAALYKSIRVEGRREIAPAEAAIRQKLARPVSVRAASMTLAAFLDVQRQGTGVSFVLGAWERDTYGETEVVLPEGADMPAERLLRAALRQVDLEWCVADGAVYVARPGSLPRARERRFYDIEPLLTGSVTAEALVDLTCSYVRPESWEVEGAVIAPWKGLLVVDQVEEVHTAIESFLDLLLNRGRRPVPPPEPWRAGLVAQLGERVSVRYDATSVADALAAFRAATGISVVARPDDIEDRSISLELTDVPRADALNWIARLAGLHVRLEDGSVVIARAPELVVRCYDVADIAAARGGDGAGAIDEIQELLCTSVDPHSWEEWCRISKADTLLVVSQTPANHARIEEELAVLRRAVAR